jgi:DNA polymerase I-like protein with 3'-5' exonuclease and polymerase domains
MKTAIFDLETNGLLSEVNTIHCLVFYDVEADKMFSFDYDGVLDGLIQLGEYDTIVGHNIIGYDIPVINKLFPAVELNCEVVDTLILAKLAYYNMHSIDEQSDIPPRLKGRYSLESFGYRLNDNKGDFGKQDDAWDVYTPEMLEYCEQDVKLTAKLYKKLLTKDWLPAEALRIEQEFAKIITQQTIDGWEFDVELAQRLHVVLLAEKNSLESELHKVFKPKYFSKGVKQYKKEPFNRLGIAHWEHNSIQLTTFNPGSRNHIAKWLGDQYGWKPKKSEKGNPIVDEAVLSKLKYPEARLLSKYFNVNKLLGMVAEGNNAWLKLVGADDRMHGQVDTVGAVTGRCTHRKPNVAQTPSSRAFMGKECRELYKAKKGYRIVGVDASGLELRMLAHFMAKWDGGSYGQKVLEEDIHYVNGVAAGLMDKDWVKGSPEYDKGRGQAKTFIYAFLYGAGDGKIGSIVGGKAKEGKALKAKFFKTLPALEKLINAVTKSASRGFITGITGRRMYIRSPHAALNTLLQSAGAYVMKYYTVQLANNLKGFDARMVGNIHDEVQMEVLVSQVDEVKKIAEASFAEVTKLLNFRIKLEGEAQDGTTWYDTH